MKVISLVLILFLFNSFIFSELDDFKKGIEKEEEENKKSEIENEETEYVERDKQEKEMNPILKFIFKITFQAWIYHNKAAYYSSYPYSQLSYNHVAFDFSQYDDDYNYDSNYLPQDLKNSWGEFYFGGAGLLDGGFGPYVNFNAKLFNFVGLDFEYRSFFDLEDNLHIIFAGGSLSFFQTDPFSFDFYFQLVNFNGLFERDGGIFGARVLMFPFKPISVDFKIGRVFFTNAELLQIDTKISYHISRYEVFIRYSGFEASYTSLRSVGGGVGIYF